MAHFPIDFQAPTASNVQQKVMRSSFVLVVLVLALAACVQGLTTSEKSASSVNRESTISYRRLKGAITATEGAVAEDEEREAMTKISVMLKGAFSPITKLFGTSTTSKVRGLQKDAQLVNSIKGDARLQHLGTAIAKNPGALTEKKVGRIGEFIGRLKKIEFTGDVYGMRIAYGLLFLAIFGILGTGYLITRNVQNSYIHSETN
ncbi:hypothetical protein GN244_ATG01413 [Phytophthora infestans]|uniref:Secreted RxLR effector peptide protein n=1 Tax=Phytophthora infestans TaxID=4787 RepID=A0A833TG62_PHYIN|nr:hypothetical protein GN244_ATG01413 [Phytophthora infestans]